MVVGFCYYQGGYIMKKKLLIICLAIALIFGFGGIAEKAVAAENISVVVNSVKLSFDVPPSTINGRTMVPMRTIFESLGATVDYNSANKTITAKKDSTTVIAKLGSKVMTVNGTQKTMDVAPATINGRTLVPTRFVAEAFDCDVQWIASTKTVVITTSSGSNPPPSSNQYYPGTTIPTYTSITGTPLIDQMSDNGLTLYAYNYNNSEEAATYIATLQTYYGWNIYTTETEPDYSEITYYLQKGNSIVSITVTFKYMEVWIIC